MLRLLSRYWWVLVLRGVMAILFGVLAFTLPFATAAALILVFGAYAIADGVFAIGTGLAGRKVSADWWVPLLHGIFGIGIGLLTLSNPALTALALLLYIAVWAVAGGVLQVFAALRLRHELTGEWWLVLGGLVGAAFGIFMLARPGAGALAVLWMIASFAIVWGVILMVGGFEVHRARKHVLA